MLFWLKKTFSFWLMPLPFCLMLLVGGFFLFRLAGPARPRQRRIGWNLLGAGLLLLLFFSNHLASVCLVRPLENRYAAMPEFSTTPVPAALARCRYVVVLGGGHTDNPALPAVSQLSSHALARLTEGVRLLRALPDAQLIVTGPGVDGRPTHASLLAQAAIALGVDPGRIIKVEQVLDTDDESQAVRRLAGESPVALVTSAWHLPRAAALFRHAGIDALPCPAGYLIRSAAGWSWGDLHWDSASLECSTLAMHEYLGALWLKLRGQG